MVRESRFGFILVFLAGGPLDRGPPMCAGGLEATAQSTKI